MMLVPIKLYTKEMEFVAEIQCIKMNPMPDAVLWGERHFLRKDDNTYIEIFVIAIFTEEEYKEMLET
jgi:hypothetical protein